MPISKNLFSLLVLCCGIVQRIHCAESVQQPLGPAKCFSSSRDYELAARDYHNFFRNKHQSPPLELDDELNLGAQQCAEYYASKGTIDSTCIFKNSTGENQYAAWYQLSSQPSCSALANSATTYWYNGGQNYDYRNPGYSVRTGSFTQLVWKTTKTLGVGCAAKSGFAVLVTLYSPPGNRLSFGKDPSVHFRYNVLPPSRKVRNIPALQKSNFVYQSD